MRKTDGKGKLATEFQKIKNEPSDVLSNLPYKSSSCKFEFPQKSSRNVFAIQNGSFCACAAWNWHKIDLPTLTPWFGAWVGFKRPSLPASRTPHGFMDRHKTKLSVFADKFCIFWYESRYRARMGLSWRSEFVIFSNSCPGSPYVVLKKHYTNTLFWKNTDRLSPQRIALCIYVVLPRSAPAVPSGARNAGFWYVIELDELITVGS